MATICGRTTVTIFDDATAVAVAAASAVAGGGCDRAITLYFQETQ